MPNTGVLFINDKKTSTNQPDHKGQVEIEGRKFWVASWVRAGKSGPMQSLSFTEFTEEDYRKSAEIAVKKAEALALQAQQEAAQLTQNINSRWGAPQQNVPNHVSTAMGVQSVPISSVPLAQEALGQVHRTDEPMGDFDDDIPF